MKCQKIKINVRFQETKMRSYFKLTKEKLQIPSFEKHFFGTLV